MSVIKKNLYSGIFFLLFSVFVYAESFNMTVSKADPMGPQFFPRVVAFTMAALSVLLFVKSAVELKKENGKTRNSPDGKKKISVNLPLLLTIGMLIVYPFLVQYIGFVILTAVYLFCQIFLLLPKGSIRVKKDLIIVLLVSILFPILVDLLFTKVFLIFLPTGLLG